MTNPPAPQPLCAGTNQAPLWISFRSEFQKYIQSLSQTVGTISSANQVSILLNVIGAHGNALYNQLQLPDSKSTDIGEVLAALEAVSFSTDPSTYPTDSESIADAVVRFDSRDQHNGESFEEFFHDITGLSVPCRFGDRQDEMLCRRIARGISETSIRHQLQKINNLTLANAAGLCRMADMLRSRSTDTINGAVVVVPKGSDATLQNGSSTECVLQKDGAKTGDKIKVENPFAMKTEHMCGFSWWHPTWMQRFSNLKSFLIVYGLLGTIQAMASLYFIVTLTTIEKRFKIPSYITGMVISGNEISQILFSLILSYAGGQRNRPRWLAWGVVFCSLSCFILALPHFLYGAGDDALHLTAEYQDHRRYLYQNSSEIPTIRAANKLCVGRVDEEECDELFSVVPLVLIFLSQFVLGIGTTLYYTLGQPYMDDNTKKTNTPIVLAYAMCLRMLGPVVGFLLGFVSLRMYIDPWKTPLINNKDPRWLGAWWFGWVLLGLTMLLFSWLIGMFPKELPKMRLLRQQSETPRVLYHEGNEEEPFRSALDIPSTQPDQAPTMNDFFTTMKRILTNKVLMYNIISAVFFILSSSGFITFFSKYMEVQFFKNSADATIIAGPVTLIGMVSGILFSGWFISKYQPSPRKLFMWNIIVGVIPMFGQTAFIFLHCESSISAVDLGSLNLTTNCNENCYCDAVPYSPVCDLSTETTYFSPCHAGCQSWNEEEKLYSNCTCSNDQIRSTTPWMLTTETYSTSSLTTSTISTTSTNVFSGTENSTDTIESITNGSLSGFLDSTTTDNTTGDFEYSDDTNLETDQSSRPKREISPLLTMIPGVCLAGCTMSFWAFTGISFLSQLMGSTGRIGNILLNLRVVSVEDKAVSQGLALMLISLFAFIPGPILFGYIIDSTCLIWNTTCGSRGNCQLYDQTNFRYYLNITSMIMCAFGVFFDVLVWFYAQDVDLYGVEEERRKKETERRNKPISPLMAKRT